jgi:hypothetical protein
VSLLGLRLDVGLRALFSAVLDIVLARIGALSSLLIQGVNSGVLSAHPAVGSIVFVVSFPIYIRIV